MTDDRPEMPDSLTGRRMPSRCWSRRRCRDRSPLPALHPREECRADAVVRILTLMKKAFARAWTALRKPGHLSEANLLV